MIVSLRKKFIIVSALSIMIVFTGIFLFLSVSNIVIFRPVWQRSVDPAPHHPHLQARRPPGSGQL